MTLTKIAGSPKAASTATSASAKKRIYGLDIAKLLAMFQVVFIHFAFYTNDVANTFISRSVLSLTVTCVPLFIAVNGAILFNRPFNMRKHVSRTITTVVLLFIWRAIHLVALRTLGAPELTPKTFISALAGANIDGYILGHFWFLYALISLYILFPILKYAWDNCRQLLYPLVLSLFLLYSCVDGIRTIVLLISPNYYDRFADAFNALSAFRPLFENGYLLLYFLGGGLLLEKITAQQDSLSSNVSNKKLIISSIVLMAGSALLTCIAKEVQYQNGFGPFGVTYGYWLPSTVLLTFSVLYLCVYIGKKLTPPHIICRVLSLLGSGTFAVYMLHIPAITLFASFESLLIPAQLTRNALFAMQSLWAFLIYIGLLLIGLLLRKLPLINKLLEL